MNACVWLGTFQTSDPSWGAFRPNPLPLFPSNNQISFLEGRGSGSEHPHWDHFPPWSQPQAKQSLLSPGHPASPTANPLCKNSETFCFRTGMCWLTWIILAPWRQCYGEMLFGSSKVHWGYELRECSGENGRGFEIGKMSAPTPTYILQSQNYAFSLLCCLSWNPYSFQQIMSISPLCE